MGDLNWLSISTRLEITTIHSILSAYIHCPSDQHLSSALRIVKYCASNPSHSLYFSYKQSHRLQAFFTFPIPNSLTGFMDANWGPMDASVSKPDTQGPEQSLLLLHLISGWIIFHHRTPVAWGCQYQKDITQSSCQAEVHTINKTTKLSLSIKLLFRDINSHMHCTMVQRNHDEKDEMGGFAGELCPRKCDL